MSNSDLSEKTWAMLCHLTSLTAFIGIPMGSILGPLIVWLIKKDTMPLVDKNGKDALNFNISAAIYAVISAITIIGIPLTILIGIMQIVYTIIASVKTNNGEDYKYPMTIKFIK